jgi:hypothetical protein
VAYTGPMKRWLSFFLFAAAAAVAVPLGCGPTCAAHEDCDAGEVCVFGPGSCAAKCSGEDQGACSGGAKCETCATSSGPNTRDCVAACVQPSGGNSDPGGGW